MKYKTNKSHFCQLISNYPNYPRSPLFIRAIKMTFNVGKVVTIIIVFVHMIDSFKQIEWNLFVSKFSLEECTFANTFYTFTLIYLLKF